jgi:heme-degrading monooxygenase HmoA
MAAKEGPITVLITYRIRDGISREKYREWSRTRDQPMASKQPGILRYEIYESEGAEDGEPWTDIVEWIEAESWEAWLAVDERPEMKEVYGEFLDISEPGTVQTIYTRRIEP